MTCTYHTKTLHTFCPGCKDISALPGTSDSWICCKCLELNYYNKASVDDVMREKGRLRWRSQYDDWMLVEITIGDGRVM